jgi:hypothetical protein
VELANLKINRVGKLLIRGTHKCEIRAWWHRFYSPDLQSGESKRFAMGKKQKLLIMCAMIGSGHQRKFQGLE